MPILFQTEDDLQYEFWEAIQRRAFPGSTSNHHLGTMTGLLFAAYEMNQFKEDYYRFVDENVKANAKHVPFSCHKVPPHK